MLSNGLSILTRENHTSPTVTSMIWYRVGSRNEAPGETGRSHFLEHMMFKGTDRYNKGEIDLLTMKNGGSNNAFTSYDFTAYYFNFAADRWELALDIEADRMTHTTFDPAEFDAEKKVVLEELKAGLDQPWGRLMQRANAEAFREHPYRNPVIGWQADVEAATVDGMKAYYRSHYHPGNATLVLVGDFETERVLDRAEAAFGSIPRGESLAQDLPGEPAQTAERRFEIEWRSEVPRVAIAYHTPAIGHPDSYPLQVLSVILAEGKASRLYQRLVEGERAATFISAEYAESRDNTLFYIRGEGRSERDSARIEPRVYDELNTIGMSGVTASELARAKHQIEAHFVFSMERAVDQAMLFGQIETLDRLDYIDRYLEHVRTVESNDVARVCRNYLTESNRTVGWLVGTGKEAEH
jgi:zinc protease